MTRRHVYLDAPGPLLISTDVHGCLDDFNALSARWRALHARDQRARWVILGDLVHGPDDRARAQQTELYGWPDDSPALIDQLWALLERHPDHVYFVIGNHDAAHVGARRTSKFYEDEATALESRLSARQLEHWRDILLNKALLAVSTACGVLLTHAAPDEALADLAMLDAITLPLGDETPAHQRAALEGLLHAYGQREEVTAKMLEQVSQALPAPQRLVIHGHDRDAAGFFTEGAQTLCPVIFGAPREARRCVLLDLAARYEDVSAIRDGVELLRVHGPAHPLDHIV